MKNLGMAVVGCGFVGRGAHVPALASLQNAELVAVADADDARLSKVVKKYEVPAGYADYRQLLEDPHVDAVVIALPTSMHAQASIAAMQAGKHVLCEMPLAANLEEVEQMIDVAKKQGVCLMPGLTFRFTPNFVKVKEMIAQGAIGNPTAALYREFIPAQDLARQWPPGAWVWNLEESGGPLYTLAVWSIDLVQWLLDSPIQTVQAAAKYTKLDRFGGTLGYDASAALQFANGLVGCLQFSGSVVPAAAGSALEIVGDTPGVLCATDNDRVTLYADQPEKTQWNVKESGPGMWGHLQQDQYFADCLCEGRTPDITPNDGRRAMEIAMQIAKPS